MTRQRQPSRSRAVQKTGGEKCPPRAKLRRTAVVPAGLFLARPDSGLTRLRLGGREGAGELALAAGGRVGMEHAAGACLVDLGHGGSKIGLGLFRVVLAGRLDGLFHRGLDDLFGDAIVPPALGALAQPLGCRRRIWHGSCVFQQTRERKPPPTRRDRSKIHTLSNGQTVGSRGTAPVKSPERSK